MDFGVFSILPDMSADPAVVARRAEELGFESYWVPDHTILPVNYSDKYPGVAPDRPDPDYLWKMPDPLMMLMRAAAVTDTIKLGTGIILVPERNPLLMAKLVATEASGRVVDRCMQMFGGLGVAKDLPFERWYREMRIRRIGEGPNEVQRHVIARELLGASLR